MEHYVGLDVSLKQTSICFVNQAGSVLRARHGVLHFEQKCLRTNMEFVQ